MHLLVPLFHRLNEQLLRYSMTTLHLTLTHTNKMFIFFFIHPPTAHSKANVLNIFTYKIPERSTLFLVIEN